METAAGAVLGVVREIYQGGGGVVRVGAKVKNRVEIGVTEVEKESFLPCKGELVNEVRRPVPQLSPLTMTLWPSGWPLVSPDTDAPSILPVMSG